MRRPADSPGCRPRRDVRRRHVQRARRRRRRDNRAWTLEPYNSAGKAAPVAAASRVAGNARDLRDDRSASTLVLGGRDRDGQGRRRRRLHVPRTRGHDRARRDDLALHGRRASDERRRRQPVLGDRGPRRHVRRRVDHRSAAPPAPDYCAGSPPRRRTRRTAPRRRDGFADPANRTTYLSIGAAGRHLGSRVRRGRRRPPCCATGTATETPRRASSSSGAKVTVEDLGPARGRVEQPLDGWRRPADALNATATDVAGIRSCASSSTASSAPSSRRPATTTCPRPARPRSPSRSTSPASPTAATRSSTIAEDTAGNVTRIERTVDLDGTPPVDLARPGQRPDDLRSGLGRARRASRAARSRSAAGATRRSSRSRRRCEDGKLIATVPRSVKGSYGIRVSASDKAGNTMSALVTSMSLSTRVGKHARKVQNERATVAYGRAVTVLGRLTTTDGSPVANQSIVVTGTLRQTGATAQPVAIAVDRHRRALLVHPARRPEPHAQRRLPGRPGILTRTRARRAARARQLDDPRGGDEHPRRRQRPLLRPPAHARHHAAAGRQDRRPPGLPARPLDHRRHHPRHRRRTAAGAPSPASAAPRAATRSACASAARRCSPTNWGTPPPSRCASGDRAALDVRGRGGRHGAGRVGEGFDHGGVEAGAGVALEFFERLGVGDRAVCDQGVEGVGDGDDAGAERDVVAGEAVRDSRCRPSARGARRRGGRRGRGRARRR